MPLENNMTIKDLPRVSREYLRKNGLISVFLFFFVMLISSSLLLISYLAIDITYIIIPFVIIPSFFACNLASFLMRDQQVLTFLGFLNCFGIYFTGKFNSTYSVIKSFFKSLVISVVFGIIYVVVINLILRNIDFMNYQASMDDILNHLGPTSENLDYVLTTYKDFINHIMIISTIPVSFVLCSLFIFFASRSSISFYTRVNSDNQIGSINLMVHKNVMSTYKKEFNLAYFSLNWPLLLIFLLSFAVGGLIGYMIMTSYSCVASFALTIGVFVTLGLYGPFLTANNEAIYLYLKDKYDIEYDKLKIAANTSMEELLKKLNEMNEDRKKDSDES